MSLTEKEIAKMVAKTIAELNAKSNKSYTSTPKEKATKSSSLLQAKNIRTRKSLSFEDNQDRPTHALINWHSDGSHSIIQVKSLLLRDDQVLEEKAIVQAKWSKNKAEEDVTIVLLGTKKEVDSRLDMIAHEKKASEHKEKKPAHPTQKPAAKKDAQVHSELNTDLVRLQMEKKALEVALDQVKKLLEDKKLELFQVNELLDAEKKQTARFKDSFTPKDIEHFKLLSKNFLAIFGTSGFGEENVAGLDSVVLHPAYPMILVSTSTAHSFESLLGESDNSTSSVFRKVLTHLLDNYCEDWSSMKGSKIKSDHGHLFSCAYRYVKQHRPNFEESKASVLLGQKIVEKRVKKTKLPGVDETISSSQSSTSDTNSASSVISHSQSAVKTSSKSGAGMRSSDVLNHLNKNVHEMSTFLLPEETNEEDEQSENEDEASDESEDE